MKLFRMQSHILSRLALIFFSILFFYLISNIASANEVVIVKGNKNISTKTIQSLAPKNIDTLNSDLINEYQKKYFKQAFLKK